MTKSSVPARRPARRRVAVLAAAAGLLLTGCGSASPGTAFQFGDERVSLARVDAAAQGLCLGLEDQMVETGQQLPLGLARKTAVDLLTAGKVFEQLMEEYDVTPGAGYQSQRAEAQRVAEQVGMSEEVGDAYVDVITVQPLAESVLLPLGEAALAEEGVNDPTPDEAAERGNALLQEAWPEAGDLDLDPRFGLESAEGQFRQADTSLSVAVSDDALAATAQEGDPGYDPGYVATLPSSQRCG